jgi:hypothetical protein
VTESKAGDPPGKPVGRFITIAELKTFGGRQWRDWFRDAIHQWHSVFPVLADVQVQEPNLAYRIRARAFRPASINPRSDDPPAELNTWLRVTLDGPSAPALGIGLLVGSWRLAYDGEDGATFAISLATLLGTADFEQCILQFLEQPLVATTRGKSLLIEALVTAIRDNVSVEHGIEVARQMRRMDWLPASSSVRLLPKFGKGNLSRLAQVLAELSPELLAESVDAPAAAELRRAMRNTKTWLPFPARKPSKAGQHYDQAVKFLTTLLSGNPEFAPNKVNAPQLAGAPVDTNRRQNRLNWHNQRKEKLVLNAAIAMRRLKTIPRRQSRAEPSRHPNSEPR